MALLEESLCINCGAPVDPSKARDGVLTCPECGMIMTLPKPDSRALSFLRQGEHDLDSRRFESAYEAYAKAAEEDPKEPEAYFGMALASFKVQYLKDEVYGRLQPICHEISERVFSEDKNYIKALQLASLEQKRVYRDRAMKIDNIRDEFYALRESGLDYDCFLCVKVTGENGAPTMDRDLANDLYYHLKDNGFKPFYSERELKGREGSAYEAFILYALYMSECMIIVCTNEEYLQTKWVKNEYLRFLQMMENEEKERDALSFAFLGSPIDRLPNGKKIQGIDLSKADAFSRITRYVETHTPEAQAKRLAEKQARAAEEKRRQEEDARRREEDERRREEDARRREEEAKRREEDQRREEELRSLREQLAELRAQRENAAQAEAQRPSASNGAKLSPAELLAMMRQAEEEEKRQREEEEKRRQEEERRRLEEERKRQEEERKRLEEERKRQEEEERRHREEEEKRLEELKKRREEEQKRREEELRQKPWLAPDYPTLENYDRNQFEIEGTNLVKYKVKDLPQKPNDHFRISPMEIKIPLGVTSIGDNAFRIYNHDVRGSAPKEVIIPEGVTHIGEMAFRDWLYLRKVNFPVGLTSIGKYAFQGCNNIFRIEIPETVTSIGEGAFASCGSLDAFVVSEKNPEYICQDNILYSKNKKTLIRAPKSITGIFSIPYGVISIDAGAFSRCERLTNVFIPDSVRFIGSYAFEGCQKLGVGVAGQLKIPAGVTSIGDGAFYGCEQLEGIIIPGSVTSIGDQAFYSCLSLKILKGCYGVTSIGKEAFCCCEKLNAILIPERVKSIGEDAFAGCSQLRIYCMYKKGLFAPIPQGWSEKWNSSKCPVRWGYKR